jgi:DNA-binding CsgD family transcriptional regulator
MIGGEPGVGKTRLAEEVAAEARERGFLTVTGECDDMEGGTPYQPFVEVMEHVVRVMPTEDLRLSLGDTGSELARLAPDLRRLFPGMPAAADVPPEEGRRLLFNAWSDFLERAAHTRPILITLDDVHWADDSSLLLLHHVARRLAETPVLVLCTYRDVELGVSRPLAKTLQELVRRRLAHDLLLRTLAEPAVAEMIEAYGPGAPPAGLVALVYRETEGNPFFVEEVLRHLAEEGKLFDAAGGWRSDTAMGETAVPRSVRLVIEQRLARLSDGCRRLLASAAVVGRDFSFEVLQGLGDLETEALIGAIEEAERAGLIHDASRGREARYSFSHELIRQTLVGGLSLPRRQRLHLRVADTMEHIYGPTVDSHVAELAFHYRQAGAGAHPEKAVDYSIRAGAAAAGVFAWGEAVTHYEGALAASEVANVLDGYGQCELLLSLGAALFNAGEAQRLYTKTAPEAYALAMSLEDTERAARACWLAVQAIFLQFASPGLERPEYGVWAERLDRLAAEGTMSRVHADQAMARLAAVRERPEETDVRCMRAWALAQELGVGRKVTWSIYFTHAMYCQGPRFDARRRQFAQEMASLLSTPPVEVPAVTLGTALVSMAGEALRWGNRTEAARFLDLVVEFGERTGPWATQFGPSLGEALFAYMDGDLERAATAANRIFAGIASGESPVALGIYGVSFGFRPRYHLGGHWGEFPMLVNSNERSLQPLRSVILASLGRRDEARAAILRFKQMAPGGASGAPDSWSRSHLVLYLEAAVLIEDAPLAEWLAAPLWDAGPVTTGEHYTTMVNRHLGAAAALLGEPERARQHYERALGEATEMRFRPEVALTRLQLAELLLNRFPSNRQEALGHLAFAIAEFEAMKMAPSLERARALQGRLSLRGKARPAYPDGLSEREVEVLRLLAAGRTNQQIADQLCISPHTVARHVSNIFDKTAAANRADAASYANRHGLMG